MINVGNERGDWITRIPGIDLVKLGGFILPGRCQIKGLETADKFDVKEAKGTDGAYVTAQGYTPAPFQIVCKMHRKTEFDLFKKIWEKIGPKARKEGPSPQALENVLTLGRRIKTVVLQKFVEDPDNGIHSVVIHATQHFKPPKTVTATKLTDRVNNRASSIVGIEGGPTKAVAAFIARNKKP